ncbi:hypothetical protein ACP70R_007521 [Stipagrostis hirtigluma subsp. patula]
MAIPKGRLHGKGMAEVVRIVDSSNSALVMQSGDRAILKQ